MIMTLVRCIDINKQNGSTKPLVPGYSVGVFSIIAGDTALHMNVQQLMNSVSVWRMAHGEKPR